MEDTTASNNTLQHRDYIVKGVITANFIFIATLTWGADQEHGPSWCNNHSPIYPQHTSHQPYFFYASFLLQYTTTGMRKPTIKYHTLISSVETSKSPSYHSLGLSSPCHPLTLLKQWLKILCIKISATWNNFNDCGPESHSWSETLRGEVVILITT